MQEINKNICLITGINNGKYPYCHTLLIEDDITVLIDPASDPEFLKTLADKNKIDVIILSHYHEDHFWFSYIFPDAELWAPEDDAPALESLDRLLYEYRMEGERRERWKKILLEHFHYQPRRVSRLLKEGQKINLGKINLQVLHTPGHTPGHSCFLLSEQELIYLADIDLTGFGPYYGDRGSDIDLMIQSIKRVSELPCKTFIVSHEKPIYYNSIEKEALNYLSVIYEREEMIKSLLKKPKTIEEILSARIIYKKPREPKDFYEFSEWSMITKHLERMIRKGQVMLLEDKYLLA